MKSYEPQLRKEAFELFDAAMAKGSVDIVNDVAQPLTGRMTLQLIGLDPDDWVYYGRAFHDLAFGIIAPEKVAAGMKDMEERLWRDIRARIGTPDATGILKYLSEEALFNGREITLEEIWNICFILLGGGLDTTQALVGSAAVYLGQHPERQQELIDHPDRLTNAIEEFLRTTPPTQSLAREAIEDVEIAGHTIKSNTKVLCSIVGANRDPAEFPDPDHLNFERQVNRHFAFGMGQHRCLGSHLARIEIKVCLEALLDRAPGFRVADDIHKYLAKDIGFFYGYEQVKLILD
ncbi:MAG: cytochrome P450 [Novosphingobium sp.]|nr:cytochrome P450 [Novosphingobium sp.]